MPSVLGGAVQVVLFRVVLSGNHGRLPTEVHDILPEPSNGLLRRARSGLVGRLGRCRQCSGAKSVSGAGPASQASS